MRAESPREYPGRREPGPPWRDTWPPLAYWTRVAVTAVVVVASAGVMWTLRSVLLVLVASLVLAIGLQPAIRYLEKLGMTRGWALGTVLTSGLVVFGGLALVLVPFVVSQASELLEDLPGFIGRLEQGPSFVHRLLELSGIDAFVDGTATPQDGVSPIDPLQALSDIGGTLFVLITVAVVTPYFALEYPSIKAWSVRLLRPGHREGFVRVLGESTDLIANYIVGNLVISLIAGVVAFAGFSLLDVRFALALAAWVAFTDLIPAVGAMIGAAGVAAVVGFQSSGALLGALALLLVYQLVENYVIAPRVMKRAVDLNPATVIVALMIGGSLAGLLGALLALPVAAMVKVVVFELVLPERLERVRREVAEESNGSLRSRSRRRVLP